MPGFYCHGIYVNALVRAVKKAKQGNVMKGGDSCGLFYTQWFGKPSLRGDV